MADILHTEVLIIGSGPGGYVAAIELGRLGRKVAIIDRADLGGECLNHGCIPSKALITQANLVHKIRSAAAKNMINADGVAPNLANIQAWKSSVVGDLGKGIQMLLKGNGVQVFRGEACFKDSKSICIRENGSQKTVSFDNVIIATGSSPMDLPNFKIDGHHIIGSRESLDLTQLPKSLIVLGGGVIGLEMGMLYAKFGSKVSVIELMDQILPGVEMDLVRMVQRSLARLGIDVYISSQALDHEIKDGIIKVNVKTPKGEVAVEGDKLMLSVGRSPNIADLGLAAAGIKCSDKGFIEIDENCKTNIDGIYAIGDVTGPPYLAHKASHNGVKAARIIAGKPMLKHAKYIPMAVFTDPEISAVGLSEKEAGDKGFETAVGKCFFAASGRALVAGEGEGFVKVVADKNTRKILGVSMVGPHVSDLISEAALAVELGATTDDIGAIIHPHPTFPEVFAEAALACFGEAIHVLRRRT
ncbi:dihydrolipoyl dehydrogenase [Elusimicrobiota bacterium]